jgi:hypothetical protein
MDPTERACLVLNRFAVAWHSNYAQQESVGPGATCTAAHGVLEKEQPWDVGLSKMSGA